MTDLETIVAANPASGWGEYDKQLKIGGVKMTCIQVTSSLPERLPALAWRGLHRNSSAPEMTCSSRSRALAC
jgi:hypothetical protein